MFRDEVTARRGQVAHVQPVALRCTRYEWMAPTSRPSNVTKFGSADLNYRYSILRYIV